MAGGETKQATTTAYVCIDRTCGLSIEEFSILNAQLFH